VAEFAPGIDLGRAFYQQVVAPRLAGIRHSAARLGSGSDVLGYDTPRSTDHDWGARLAVLVDQGEPHPLAGVPAVTGWASWSGSAASWPGIPVRCGYGNWPASGAASPRRNTSPSKWLGMGFARLDSSTTVGPLLAAALTAPDWPAAQQPLVAASQQAAIRHNHLELTRPLDPSPRPFHDRP
jgi:hypothetical protein